MVLSVHEGSHEAVKPSFSYSEQHKTTKRNFVSNNSFNSENVYPIDINISELINGGTNRLTEFTNPITLILPLPDSFVGLDNLIIVDIHNGNVEQLDVTVKEDGTF